MKKGLILVMIMALLGIGLFANPVARAAGEGEDAFLIGVFWPPVADFTNAEQYDYLKEAHVNYIQNVSGNDLNDTATNLKMLDLAAERGMKVSVADTEYGDLMNATDEQIRTLVNRYKEHPGFGGIYIKDEPGADLYPQAARVYKEVLKAAPNSIPYVNLFPHHTAYFQQWIDMVGASSLKYLSFDFYPYLESGAVKPDYYSSLEGLRAAGVKNGVKTAVYLQSVGIPNYLARPDENMLRHNVFTNLAYGVKSVTWFTWWTPTGRSETFTDAVISPDGKKTDLFEPVRKLNGQMQAWGPTLMRLEAVEAFHTGTIPAGVQKLPDHYFVQSVNPQDDLVISRFVDRTSGRNYLMAVNKSMTETKTVTLQFDPDRNIDRMSEVSKDSGAEEKANYDKESGILSDEFLPGEGRLYALPAAFVYQIPQQMAPELPDVGPFTNLALGRTVTASSDIGQWGWSVRNVVDGQRTSAGSSSGWSSYNDIKRNHTEWVTIDLGAKYGLTTVDLYPRSDEGNLGLGYPTDFTIQVSEDNANWTTVVNGHQTDRPSGMLRYEFAAKAARYVKVEGTNLTRDPFGNYHMQFAEIEVYARTGSNLNVKMTPSKLLVGKTGALSVTGWTPDGQPDPLNGALIRFSSSDNSVASVDDHGIVTAHSDGKALIGVTAMKEGGETETGQVEITVQRLSDPWQAEFYGNANALITQTDNGFEIKANGLGTGQAQDDLVYLYQALNTVNPVTVEAEVGTVYKTLNGINGHAGIMIRNGEASDPAASFVHLSVSAEGRIVMTARTESGGLEEIKGDYYLFPTVLKLEKTGNRFVGFYKKAGEWVPFHGNPGQSGISVNMEKSIKAGIAVFSNDSAFTYTKLANIYVNSQPND